MIKGFDRISWCVYPLPVSKKVLSILQAGRKLKALPWSKYYMGNPMRFLGLHRHLSPAVLLSTGKSKVFFSILSWGNLVEIGCGGVGSCCEQDNVNRVTVCLSLPSASSEGYLDCCSYLSQNTPRAFADELSYLWLRHEKLTTCQFWIAGSYLSNRKGFHSSFCFHHIRD